MLINKQKLSLRTAASVIIIFERKLGLTFSGFLMKGVIFIPFWFQAICAGLARQFFVTQYVNIYSEIGPK